MFISKTAAQSTLANSANILFNPQINVGDGRTNSQADFKPTTSATPKIDNSTTGSLGFGLKNGKGGDVKRSEDPYTETVAPTPTAFARPSNSPDLEKYLPYVLFGGGALILYKTMKTKKAS